MTAKSPIIDGEAIPVFCEWIFDGALKLKFMRFRG